MNSAPRPRPGVPFSRFFLLALAVAMVDQASKLAILGRMELGESFPVLGPVMSFTRRANPGALFGMFASAGLALTVVSGVLIILLLAWGLRASTGYPKLILPLALILGGAVGNLIDRLFHGEVVDFLDFHFWPVFNLADVALTCGVALAAYLLIFAREAAGAKPMTRKGG